MRPKDRNFTAIFKRMQTEEVHYRSILKFYRSLSPDFNLPPDVSIMNPFEEGEGAVYAGAFYRKFYDDRKPRVLIFGINPGRFGGGITGVPFTDPVKLADNCGIPNALPPRTELSAGFIYDMIEAYGGPAQFYSRYFISALSPLGFVKNGLNLNYYDDKQLLSAIEPFVFHCIEQQKKIFNTPSFCYCLGEGTNFKIFKRWNEKYEFFREIIPLPHPRWIMQYRRKRLNDFIQLYLDRFRGQEFN